MRRDSQIGAGIDNGPSYKGPLHFPIPARESVQGGLMTIRDVCLRLSVVLRRHVDRRGLFRIRKADPTFPRQLDIGWRRAVIYRAQDIHDWCKAQS